MHLSAICFHFLERRNEKPQNIEKRRKEKKETGGRKVVVFLAVTLSFFFFFFFFSCMRATCARLQIRVCVATLAVLQRSSSLASTLTMHKNCLSRCFFFFAKSEWRRRADDIYFCNVCVWVCQHDHRAYRNNARARAGRCAAHLKRCVCYLCCLT